ncbi:hypothetical protein RB195_002206 [Necator americanus]|uniref:Uncharacterized protein n=1 Tax=Necator americanus TaxID=51031 RepID=A0ABR1DI73_NECAM
MCHMPMRKASFKDNIRVLGRYLPKYDKISTVDSMNSPPDAQHDLLLMDFTFHERIRHFIASAPRTFTVESAASGEQLSADVQASLAVAVAQCMGEPQSEFLHHSERSQSIAHGGQRTAKTGSKLWRFFPPRSFHICSIPERGLLFHDPYVLCEASPIRGILRTSAELGENKVVAGVIGLDVGRSYMCTRNDVGCKLSREFSVVIFRLVWTVMNREGGSEDASTGSFKLL